MPGEAKTRKFPVKFHTRREKRRSDVPRAAPCRFIQTSRSRGRQKDTLRLRRARVYPEINQSRDGRRRTDSE